MAIIQTRTNSFILECLEGYHCFGGSYRAADTFNIALYTINAQLDATTTVYTSTNEVSGTGYTAGGQALTIISPQSYSTTTGGVAFLSFNPAIWTPASGFTASGALIYNASQGNRSVAVLAFGNAIAPTNNSFTINFPFNSYGTAVLRST
jgi:hypothetical protein